MAIGERVAWRVPTAVRVVERVVYLRVWNHRFVVAGTQVELVGRLVARRMIRVQIFRLVWVDPLDVPVSAVERATVAVATGLVETVEQEDQPVAGPRLVWDRLRVVRLEPGLDARDRRFVELQLVE